MSESAHVAHKPRSLTARRLALLATVAVLGTGVLFTAPAFLPQGNAQFLAPPAHA